ncbi:MAG: ATP-dependent helicase [Chitinophagaceae bacterium]|nr:ATP-dependent helicase [Chitinophagaceae bacterium]
MSLNQARLEKKFHEEYEKLNPKQRLAVDTIEGPVMVIAGPGTGKTQILACRIGKILLDTDISPENILCLTYTDAGVVAMRKRLLQFIGPEAYKVNIYTFHAFCNDIIQENLHLFEKTSLDAISELEKIELLKKLIDGFKKDNLLKRYRGDVYFEVKNLDKLFSTMKQEGWTPEYINTCIDSYLADLPLRDEYIYKKKYKDFKAGDLKKDKFEEEKERMEKLRAAVNEFNNFQQLMRTRNRYDFDDMINWVLRVFSEQPQVLARYQEKFQYILVDEYQDTSGTQNQLVKLLISYWETPNVFVVGDDDQSIYRFQGANVENMKTFADDYTRDLVTVVLTNNYRSTQPILDLSMSLINRNEERLVKKIPGLSKDLLASNAALVTVKHKPVIHEYESIREEMTGIARDVQALVRKGVPAGEIGIIYKENKYGEELARFFKLMNIPVFSKRHVNMLQIPLARKIMLILEWLSSEHHIPYSGDELLFEMLHADWLGIAPIDIAKITMEAAEIRYDASKDAPAASQGSLRQLLVDKAKMPSKDLFTQVLPEPLKKAGLLIEDLVGAASNMTLQHLFEYIIRKAGVLAYIMQHAEKHWYLQVLTGLFDFIKEESQRNTALDLKGLVDLIKLMDKEGISLPLVQVSGNDKGVNLLTAHGSKGLEFEYVFFAGCNAGFWEKKRNPNQGFKLPDTIFSTQPAANNEEELRRLFYVAITRAEQYLYVSYSRFKNDGKEMEPSRFIAELMDEQDISIEKIVMDADTLATFAALGFGEEKAPEIARIEEEVIGRVLEKFVMNVTALNNYLKCPLEFYFKNLIRIPSPKNEATEFGSAVHHALEKLFRKMQDSGKDKFPLKNEFINDFEWYMKRHRDSFTQEQYDRRLEYGQTVLDAYYDQSINNFNKIVTIERNIRGVVIEGVPLKGKLDKLEFDGKFVNVVDYKTGDPEKGIPKTKGPSEKVPLGGDYWRQAVFYKILVDHYGQKDWKVISTEFDFIEPDKKKNYRREKLIITDPEIEIVTAQIKDTWARIQNREFYTGCGKEDCHWCEFVKTNNLAVAMYDLETEEDI